MDSPACHVIYVNSSVGPERLLRAETIEASAHDWQDEGVRGEVQSLLEAFDHGMSPDFLCAVHRIPCTLS